MGSRVGFVKPGGEFCGLALGARGLGRGSAALSVPLVWISCFGAQDPRGGYGRAVGAASRVGSSLGRLAEFGASASSSAVAVEKLKQQPIAEGLSWNIRVLGIVP